MPLKATSFKLEEKVLTLMKYYCGCAGISQAEFIKSAIIEKCETIQTERCGGMIGRIPNPQINHYTPDQAGTAINILSEAATSLTKNCPGLDFGLYEIADFASERLYKNTDRQREQFMSNFNNDIDFNHNLYSTEKED